MILLYDAREPKFVVPEIKFKKSGQNVHERQILMLASEQMCIRVSVTLVSSPGKSRSLCVRYHGA